MKGPWSADRLFFISSLSFAVSLAVYTAMSYLWPIPYDPNYLPQPSGIEMFISQIAWALSTAGVVTFILGLVARGR